MRYHSRLLISAGFGIVAFGWFMSLQASGLIQSAYNLIQNGGTAVAREPTLNFVNGGCVDNAGSGRTDCTIAAGGGGIVTYSGAALTPSGTVYFPIGGGGASSATETNVDIEAPAAATVSNFYVQLSAVPGTGNSIAFTWRKNAAATALTCTIGAAATTCNDTTHTFSAAQGDLVDIPPYVDSNTPAQSTHLKTFMPVPIPGATAMKITATAAGGTAGAYIVTAVVRNN